MLDKDYYLVLLRYVTFCLPEIDECCFVLFGSLQIL